MVPKIAKRGGSFKGAAAYYLHDKGADTNRRVAFCQTENLPVAEPELAWRWMAYTARHADILKTDAGVGAAGRKMSKPVYTLSLSWSPEESPSQAEMVEAAHSALKALGLSKCQTLLVAHNDEPHPHIHAIVNLVDPDTGKVRDPGMDRRKLSRWAEAYEKAHGKIRCAQRVENNARRDQGQPARDTASRTRQDIEQARLIEREILRARREQLWARQVADREALKRQAEARAQAIRAELKERFRPQWAALYKKQRQDKRDVANARRSVLSAMRVAIKERRRLTPDGRAGIRTILAYAISARSLSDALRAAEERELAALRQKMADTRRELVKAVWQDYDRDFKALRETQAEERKSPPPREVAVDAKRRAELEAALEARRRRKLEAQKPPPEQKKMPEAQPPRPQPRSSAPPERRGPVRLALPEVGGSTPATDADDAARRREALKAEFRRQAEEIARRRRERGRKDRDRDRER